MCKDMIRHIYTLQGTAFIESELAYYKAFEARRFGAPAVPAPAAVAPPAPPALVLHLKEPAPVPLARPSPAPVCTVKKEHPAPAPAPTADADSDSDAEEEAADAPAAGGAGAVAPAEKKTIQLPTASTAVEKTRYKRSELPDEERCIEPTARGTRCTLGRESADSSYCSRHGKKHSS
jgi:hypothetical protein